jgi:succinate dehydrogenase hydrophobic anchor subunit
MRERHIWILQMVTALLLFVLLLGHIFWMHYHEALNLLGIKVEKVLAYEHVRERSKNLALSILYVIFLACALIHGLIGLRNIIIETSIGQKFGGVVVFLLVFLGLLFFAGGVFVIVMGLM